GRGGRGGRVDEVPEVHGVREGRGSRDSENPEVSDASAVIEMLLNEDHHRSDRTTATTSILLSGNRLGRHSLGVKNARVEAEIFLAVLCADGDRLLLLG